MNFRRIAILGAGALALSLPAAPAMADSAEYFRARIDNGAAPKLLSQADREYYRALFRAIDREEWSEVEQQLNRRSGDRLHDVAKAEFYLHANSPRVELRALEAWMQTGRNLPQAEQLNNLALKRGATSFTNLPQERSFVRQPYATKRINPRSIE